MESTRADSTKNKLRFASRDGNYSHTPSARRFATSAVLWPQGDVFQYYVCVEHRELLVKFSYIFAIHVENVRKL